MEWPGVRGWNTLERDELAQAIDYNVEDPDYARIRKVSGDVYGPSE